MPGNQARRVVPNAFCAAGDEGSGRIDLSTGQSPKLLITVTAHQNDAHWNGRFDPFILTVGSVRYSWERYSHTECINLCRLARPRTYYGAAAP